MGRTMWEYVFGHMQTVKGQTSLDICDDWSEPALSSNRIIGYYRLYEWKTMTMMILYVCARLSDSTHLHMFQGTFFHGTQPIFYLYVQ